MADSRGGTAEFWSPTQDGVTALGAADAPRAWEMGTHSHRGATLLSSSSDSGSPAGAPPQPEMVKVHAAAAAHAFGCRSLHPALCSPVPFLARAEPTSTQGNTHSLVWKPLAGGSNRLQGPGWRGGARERLQRQRQPQGYSEGPQCVYVCCVLLLGNQVWAASGLGRRGLLAGVGCGDSFLRAVAPGTRLPGTRGFRLGAAGQASTCGTEPGAAGAPGRNTRYRESDHCWVLV